MCSFAVFAFRFLGTGPLTCDGSLDMYSLGVVLFAMLSGAKLSLQTEETENFLYECLFFFFFLFCFRFSAGFVGQLPAHRASPALASESFLPDISTGTFLRIKRKQTEKTFWKKKDREQLLAEVSVNFSEPKNHKV